MGLYQVELTTNCETLIITVNAYDENEAISIAETMFRNGEIPCVGCGLLNIAAYPA